MGSFEASICTILHSCFAWMEFFGLKEDNMEAFLFRAILDLHYVFTLYEPILLFSLIYKCLEYKTRVKESSRDECPYICETTK